MSVLTDAIYEALKLSNISAQYNLFYTAFDEI